MRRVILVAVFLLSSLSVVAASAQTLKTFTDGQPAVAADVNQNFTLLLNEITQLKAQIAALQPAALAQAVVGTWDVVSMDTTQFEPATVGYNFTFSTASNKSVLVLNANGTFANTVTGLGYQMQVFNTRVPFVIPNGGGSFIRSDIYTGTQNKIPDNFANSGTYTVSGGKVILTLGAETITLNVSTDGLIMTGFIPDATTASIAIAIKR